LATWNDSWILRGWGSGALASGWETETAIGNLIALSSVAAIVPPSLVEIAPLGETFCEEETFL